MQLEETRSVFSKLNKKLQDLSKQLIDTSKENQKLKEQLALQENNKLELEEKAYDNSKQLLTAYNLKCKENDILQKKILIKQKQLQNIISKEVSIEKDSEETLNELNNFKEQIYAKETAIQQLKDKYSKLANEKMLNKTLKVLVDGPSNRDETVLAGYSEESKLVHFKGDEKLIGEIVEVTIKEARKFNLIGELNK